MSAVRYATCLDMIDVKCVIEITHRYIIMHVTEVGTKLNYMSVRQSK